LFSIAGNFSQHADEKKMSRPPRRGSNVSSKDAFDKRVEDVMTKLNAIDAKLDVLCMKQAAEIAELKARLENIALRKFVPFPFTPYRTQGSHLSESPPPSALTDVVD
jgi:hypothetical protein